MDCLFCKVISGEIPAKLIYQDDLVTVFDDIKPQAPQHKLIVPLKHIANINALVPEDNQLIGHMIQIAKKIAQQLNIDEEGYRLIFNCNAAGGQTVFHLHLHLLGGRQMSWPPG